MRLCCSRHPIRRYIKLFWWTSFSVHAFSAFQILSIIHWTKTIRHDEKKVTSPYRKMKILTVLPCLQLSSMHLPHRNIIILHLLKHRLVLPWPQRPIEKEARGIVVNEEGTPLKGVKIVVSKSLIGFVTGMRAEGLQSQDPRWIYSNFFVHGI